MAYETVRSGQPNAPERYPNKSVTASVATSTPLSTAMLIYEGEALGFNMTNGSGGILSISCNLYITDSTACVAWNVLTTTLPVSTYKVFYYTPTTTPPYALAEILVGSTIATTFNLDVTKIWKG